MRVVIADDSALISERLQEILSISGQEELVGSFDNGTDTLLTLRNLKPNLAIVDIEMPGLSGLEVLTKIRKENKNPRVHHPHFSRDRMLPASGYKSRRRLFFLESG